MPGLVDFLLHPPSWLIWLLWASFAYVVVRLLWFVFPFIPLGLKAKLTGVQIGWLDLLGIQMRNGVAGMRTIVDALIVAKASKLQLSPIDVETLHLARGNAGRAILALELTKKCDQPLTWKEASALEIMSLGEELLEASRDVHNSKNTRKLDDLRSKLSAS